MATAFFAKSIFNLATTRQMMDRLRCDSALRRPCGWNHAKALPHESKFSRAFALFAISGLPQQLHAASIAATQYNRLNGRFARDSTAIYAREHVAEALLEQKRQAKAQSPKRNKPKATERGTRIQRQRLQQIEAMLVGLPRHCDIGGKKNSKGHVNNGAVTNSTLMSPTARFPSQPCSPAPPPTSLKSPFPS